MVEYKKPFIYLLWKAHKDHLKNIQIADTIVFEDGDVESWFRYSKKQSAILKKQGLNSDLASVLDDFQKHITHSSTLAAILRNYDPQRDEDTDQR